MQQKESAYEKEQRIKQKWQSDHTFQQSIAQRKKAKPFVFYEGPPTANGLPHVGHAFGRTVKDIVARYKTMQGFYVERKAGWDTHGLPVELAVEKELGISGKQEIEKYGIEKFIKKCQESVFTYEKKWRVFTEDLGYWLDMENPYVTLENNYIESVWSILSHVHKNGELYKGHRVSPYCPSCQTSLSSHEVAQGYKDVKDLSATAKFKLVNEENVYFLGWTTTPWTLPANVALAVNATLQYAKVQYEGDYYIVVQSLVEKLFSGQAQIVETMPGSALKGLKYEAPFNFVTLEKGHEVVLADYVTDSSGTGIVHIAPAYGEDDYRIVKENGLSFVNIVDGRGCYTAEVPPLAGRFVKDCDVDIIKMLAQSGRLFSKEKYEHSYPHCWRCDSPLLYYATDSWFINMQKHRDELVKLNSTVNWYPEHIKEGRFGNFLDHVLDWNISRNRYWGTPLNVWQCDECGHEVAPASIAELQQLSGQSLDTLELHKPYIDTVVCQCPLCEHTMHRTPEVIDVWFDSGSMPFAQHHYPFNKDIDFSQSFPADVVIEGIDQTRGFFYSLLAVSTLYKGVAPYKNVLSLGHILDEDGRKMSKSKGNALEPSEMMEAYGADALRWAFMTDSAPWNPKRFSHKTVQEAKSKFVDTFDNVFRFYKMYADIDGYVYDAQNKGIHTKMDEWILSRLEHTKVIANKAMEQYDFTQASREMGSFIEELSNWYIRRNRARFWATGMSDDKLAAYATLYESLTTIAQLAAPFTPFITEDVYTTLTGQSVHLADYPIGDASTIDVTLEAQMVAVRNIVELGRRIRNSSAVKVKQPLSELFIVSPVEELQDYAHIIKEELNIKELHFVKTLEDYEKIDYKLNFKTAGIAFGKNVNVMKSLVENLTEQQKRQFKLNGSLVLHIDDEPIVLKREHVEKTSHVPEGFAFEEEAGYEVLMNLQLTEDLLQEGQMREMIRIIQEKRKALDLPVEKYIEINFSANEENIEILKKFEALLQANMLVKRFNYNKKIVTPTITTKLFDDELWIELVY